MRLVCHAIPSKKTLLLGLPVMIEGKSLDILLIMSNYDQIKLDRITNGCSGILNR